MGVKWFIGTGSFKYGLLNGGSLLQALFEALSLSSQFAVNRPQEKVNVPFRSGQCYQEIGV